MTTIVNCILLPFIQEQKEKQKKTNHTIHFNDYSAEKTSASINAKRREEGMCVNGEEMVCNKKRDELRKIFFRAIQRSPVSVNDRN